MSEGRVTRLRSLDLPDLLARLGVTPDDAHVIAGWAGPVLASPEDCARIEELAHMLVSVPCAEASFTDEDAVHPLGRGVLPVFALLATVDDVRAAHAARGVPDDISWATLADLGAKITKDRHVNGTTGLHNQFWLHWVWGARLFRLGRLQFELITSTLGRSASQEPEPVLSVHIPAGGPLTPALVDESFARAAPFFAEHFPDEPVRWFVCNSWLLDPVLPRLLPGSNVAAFAERWDTWAQVDGDGDVLYFAFDVTAPAEWTPAGIVDTLPEGSSLHRALAAHWRDGGHFQRCWGRVPIEEAGRESS